jgi:glycosyltransferase involved in cell wall biosynthesis
MKKIKTPSVCLVYDKVTTRFGGAEHVIQALHEVFPDAPLYTSLYHAKQSNWANNLWVKPSFLQHLPLINRYPRALAWLMPLAFEAHDLSEFDIVISVTSAQAKGVLTKPHQLHLCYLLTPPRYLYSHQQFYLSSQRWLGLPLIKQVVQLGMSYLGWWDQQAALRPDIIIPISKLVQKRVSHYYHRPATAPIYPPLPQPPTLNKAVKTATSLPLNNYILCISRLVAYKRIDLAVHACRQLNLPLIVAGVGEESKNLQKIFPRQTTIRQGGQSLESCLRSAIYSQKQLVFVGQVTAEESKQLFQQARAIIMPGQEDFGITALEALGYGKPVIVHAQSGVAESLRENIDAIFLNPSVCSALPKSSALEESLNLHQEQSLVEEVRETISALSKVNSINTPAKELQRHAQKFNWKTFTSQVKKIVYDEWKQHQHAHSGKNMIYHNIKRKDN